MKAFKITFLVFVLLQVGISCAGQDGWEWAPIGAEWKYRTLPIFEPSRIVSLQVVGETIINNARCKIFKNEFADMDCSYDAMNILCYDQGVISLLVNDSLEVLYNFNLMPSDSIALGICGLKYDSTTFYIENVGIDDLTGYRTYNFSRNQYLSPLEVNYVNNELYGGADNFLLPYSQLGEVHYKLLCYSDPTITINFDHSSYPPLVNRADTCQIVVVSSEEISNSNLITLYPNPASDFILIEAKTDLGKNAIVQVMDIQGRILIKYAFEKVNNRLIDISTLSEGIYPTIIFNEDKILYINKVIVHR